MSSGGLPRAAVASAAPGAACVATNATRPTRVSAAARLQEAGDGGRVAPRVRVVVVAHQEELVGQAADLLARRVDEAEAEVLRRELDAEEVAGDPPARRQDHDPRRVGELLLRRRPRRTGSRPPS